MRRRLEAGSALERIVFAVHGEPARAAFQARGRRDGAMSELTEALADAGGAGAPPAATARLRGLLVAALRHGRAELALKRSGYGAPVEVAVGADGGRLLAATPADAAIRADPLRAAEREWLLVAAVVGALVELTEPGAPADAAALGVIAGDLDGFLAVALPAPALDPATLDELVPLAFDDHASGIDRLRASAVAIPGALLADVALREPIGAGHPLRIAEAVARLGGRPADPRSVEEHEEVVYPLLDAGRGAPIAPHEDPDPARRDRPPDPPAAERDGQVGRVPHGLRAPRARIRRQRPEARPGGGGGAARRRPAGGEAVGRPAPRLPEPAACRGCPPDDRDGRRAAGVEAAGRVRHFRA